MKNKSKMTEQNQNLEIVAEHLADLQDTMQKEKIKLTPEVESYMKTNVAKVHDKLAKGEPVYSSDMEFIEKIKAWIKILGGVSEENCRAAVENAKEMDPGIEIPSDLRQKFINELMTYSLKELKEICDECEKPRIVIVTANSFEDKITNMNINKHYEEQKDAYIAPGGSEPYSNVKTVDKVRVGIADLVPHPQQQKGAPVKLGARRDFELARFAKTKKVSLAGPHVMAAAYQQILREAERKGDNSVIFDTWEGEDTTTILNPENLMNSQFVAYAYFDLYDRRVDFHSLIPYREHADIRGRAWVQVLEF